VTFPTIAVQSKRDPPYTNSLRNGLQSIMKPGPEPLSNKAMTAAERQARFRATHANGAPRIRYQNPADRHSRAQRWWHAAVAELIALQDDYRTWLNALPQNLEASATAEALRAICDLDLSYIESVEPPRGFGRD